MNQQTRISDMSLTRLIADADRMLDMRGPIVDREWWTLLRQSLSELQERRKADSVEPALYMNRFTRKVFSLEEQPGADKEPEIYVPLYDVRQRSAAQNRRKKPRRDNTMKTITVMVEIDVPDNATYQDITDFVDVEYGQCGSMKSDNPCRDNEIICHVWEYGPGYKD